MARPNPRKLPFAPMAGAPAAQADEALRHGRFKEAVELYKQLLKQEARPEWRDALADAYVGRAKALFAKGLFKEAEIVLGNAAALDGAVKEPLFLISCLVRQGQLDKALAQGLKHVGTDALEPGEGRLLSELTAAIFLARPVPLAARDSDPPARVEWIAAANAARNALAALTAQKPPDEIEPFIAAIPARSPFGPVRLIVKSLIIDDPAKARRLIDGVPQASPFGPLRLAAEATLPADPAEVVGRLNEASPAQRAFALEWLGASANGPSMLARLLDAKRSGPGQLFAFLTRQPTTLPAADVRNACFNLLPQIPDRIVPFERSLRETVRGRESPDPGARGRGETGLAARRDALARRGGGFRPGRLEPSPAVGRRDLPSSFDAGAEGALDHGRRAVRRANRLLSAQEPRL